jgi:adenylate cyclase
VIGEHLKGSEVKLWQLVDARTQPGADRKAIDQRIWDLFGQEWAIVFTDLSGFSRNVAKFGIIHFLQVINDQKKLLTPIVEKHDGIVVKVEADSFLILMRKASTAVKSAIEMQRACHEFNKTRATEDQVLLCVGIGYGRVLRVGDTDVYGHEVNLSSKLGEDTALANEILLTEAAVEAAGEILGTKYLPRPGSGRNFQLKYSLE